MSKKLPAQPSLDQLKNQARDLQKAHNNGAADACSRLKEFLPRCAALSAPEIAAAKLNLRDAQQVIAREYGFSSWQKLKRHLEEAVVDFEVLFQRVEARPQDAAQIVRMLQTSPRQLGVLMIALGEQRVGMILKFLSDAEIENTVRSIGELGPVDEAAKQAALATLERQSAGAVVVEERTDLAGHGDFIFGALGQAVGNKRAREMLARQGIVATGGKPKAKPRLSKKYLLAKSAFKRELQERPTQALDLDGIRQVMVKLAEMARVEGLLALEEVVDDKAQVDGLLRYGLQLAVDGTDPDIIEEMLTTQSRTLVQNLETRCQMIVACVRAIQNDENPRIVDHRLASFYKT
jgi:hypothetical protein